MARDRKTEASEDPFLDDIEAILDEDLELSEEAVEIDEIAALRGEVADLKDRLLRALADAENVRKRAERDRRDAEIYGATRLARDLLPVHDNFARALENATDAVRAAAPGLMEGIELTQRALLTAFEKNKILPIAPEAGERFDPNLHQAMFEAPVPGTKSGDIIQVMGTGFTIGERLLRPAQVGVSSGGPAVPRPAGGSDVPPDAA